MPEPKKLLKLVEIGRNSLLLLEIAPNCMTLDCMKLPKITPNCSKLPELCSNDNRKLPNSESKIANIDDKSKLPHIFIGQPPRPLT